MEARHPSFGEMLLVVWTVSGGYRERRECSVRTLTAETKERDGHSGIVILVSETAVQC